MKISLVLVKTDGTHREFPVSKKRVVVGRTTECDLRIPLPSVSREHCELVREGAEVKVRDLGSSNGTFHNGNRVQEASLAAGDRIGVGPVELTAMIDGKPGVLEIVKAAKVARLRAPDAAAKSSSKAPAAPSSAQKETVDMDDPIAALEAMSSAPVVDPDDVPLVLDDEKDDKPRARK